MFTGMIPWKLKQESNEVKETISIFVIDCIVVCTNVETAVSNIDVDMESVSPCNYDEADTRMLHHMKNIAE